MKTKFAERLFEATNRMNIFGNEDDVVNKIYIGLKELSPNHLLSFINDVEPDKEYVDKVAELLGINKKWLNGLCNENGKAFEVFQLERIEKNEVFELVQSAEYLYTDTINIIIDEGGKLSGQLGTSIIIQKTDEYRYYCIFNQGRCFDLYNPCPEDSYYINKEVKYFYNIYSYLKQKQWENCGHKDFWLNKSSFQDNIYFVNDEDFYNLISGKTYPGEILKKHICDNRYLIMDLFEDGDKELDNNFKYSKWFNDLKLMIKRMHLS